MVHLEGFEAVLELQMNLEVSVADVIAGGDAAFDHVGLTVDVDEAEARIDVPGEVAGLASPSAGFEGRIEDDGLPVGEALTGASEEFVVDDCGFVAGVFGRLEEFLPYHVRPEDVGVQSVRDGAGDGGFADTG